MLPKDILWNGSGWYGFIEVIPTSTTDISLHWCRWYKIVIPCLSTYMCKIIHSLNLPDYLHVQADNPWYSYNRTSLARTGLGPSKIVLAKASSSHPGWIMHNMTSRDCDDSSSQPR